MIFYYQARTTRGEIRSGKVEASSRDSALALLRSYGLFVTLLEEEKPKFYERRIKFFERISQKEIVLFSRQLATMFQSEIPPMEVLGTVAKQIKNPYFKEKIIEMMEKVEGGVAISKTLSAYPDIFTPFYINMVRSGELSGKLSEVFGYLADYLEKDYDFRRKVKGALVYPIFLSIVFLVVIGIIIFFVVPQLAQFLSETQSELPLLTKSFFSAASFLRKWGLLLLLIPIGIVFLLYYYVKRTKEGRIFFDETILKIPFLNSFLRNVYLGRISLNLSTLISGGLPIVQSLEITSSVVGNDIYKNIILEAADRVKKGEPISAALSRHPDNFPPFFVQMMVVGEKTGHLDNSLKNTSEFYQKEVESGLENLMRILEPVLIVFFGILVGGLIAAVITPLYQIITSY